MMDTKRLAEILKTVRDAQYGYTTVNCQVYYRDVSELLKERDELLSELGKAALQLQVVDGWKEAAREGRKHTESERDKARKERDELLAREGRKHTESERDKARKERDELLARLKEYEDRPDAADEE